MKKHFLTLLFLLAFLLGSKSLQAQHVLSAGPMFHLNFGGGGKTQMSYGFELAYWNTFHLPYSFNAGVDFERGAWRLYSEAQTGVYWAGVSAGPYLEFRNEGNTRLGLQTSVWANAFLGFDFRARFTRGETRFAPGAYAKYIWVPGGALREEWDEQHESEGSDWDWD